MSDPFEIPVGDEQEQSRDFSDATVDWMNPMPQRYYRKFETDALGYRLKGVVRYDLEDGFSVDFEDYNPELFDEEDVEALGERLIEIERKAFLEQQPKPVTILKTYYFGKDVCREQDKGRATSEIEECIANGELLGSVIDKEFKTEAEMLSYEEGLEDASGWEISTYQDQAP